MSSEADSNPRIALVCDWLTEIGGAEQVILELTKIFPGAPIYTSQYRPRSATKFQGKRVITGWLNILPRALRKFIAPLRAHYFNHLHLTGYDIVISVCNAECKGIKVASGTRHIAYLQGPPTQYYWGMYDQYIANPGFGKLNWLARFGLRVLVKPMRRSDWRAAQRPDALLANSHYVADEIKRYYGRSSQVLFPLAQVDQIKLASQRVKVKDIRQIRRELFGGGDFYVVAGRQVNWKRFDLAIRACLETGENLLVIGSGPEHNSLVKLVGDSSQIKFLPKYDGVGEIVKYYRSAKGLIFPSLEPFGIVPVEALASGLPVLAFRRGGSADIIRDRVNGLFFPEQTVDSLAEGIKRFNVAQFKHDQVVKSAERFSVEHFRKNIKQIIEQ